MDIKYKIFNDIEIDIDDTSVQLLENSLCTGCSWYVTKRTNQIQGWCIIDGIKKKVIMSRLLLSALKSDLDVDHINRNRLDNRLSNLRLITHQQNCYNTCIYMIDKGVYFRHDRKKWCAKIRTKNGRISLGHFINKEDALAAYKKAVIEYHGEYAPV